ncbi:MAG: hypothetical protein L3J67_00880 [Hyphomicrobiaceae bacterium]|nr:hypothetical protein [Hyphomicrobiaceae bacterium]
MSVPVQKRNKKNVKSPTITMTPEVYRLYRQTIGQKEPETFALLGGRLDNPFHITEYKFCPPCKDRHGRYDASRSHVNVDHEFMNWVIDHEWVPNGKYMLGVWHSHPAGCTSPSYGDPGSNQGDVVFFSSCLNGDDSPDENWRNFIAPITTLDHEGKDLIHGWVLPKGSDRPVKAKIKIPEAEVSLYDALGFLKQCTDQDIRPWYHSGSLTQEMREWLICSLRLIGQQKIAERLLDEDAAQERVDFTV